MVQVLLYHPTTTLLIGRFYLANAHATKCKSPIMPRLQAVVGACDLATPIAGAARSQAVVCACDLAAPAIGVVLSALAHVLGW